LAQREFQSCRFVPALIEEIYTFLRQADAKELNDLFRALKKAQEAGSTSFDHFLSK
jgi:isocitrate lyase